jgi:hypothetical protein
MKKIIEFFVTLWDLFRFVVKSLWVHLTTTMKEESEEFVKDRKEEIKRQREKDRNKHKMY